MLIIAHNSSFSIPLVNNAGYKANIRILELICNEKLLEQLYIGIVQVQYSESIFDIMLFIYPRISSGITFILQTLTSNPYTFAISHPKYIIHLYVPPPNPEYYKALQIQRPLYNSLLCVYAASATLLYLLFDAVRLLETAHIVKPSYTITLPPPAPNTTFGVSSSTFYKFPCFLINHKQLLVRVWSARLRCLYRMYICLFECSSCVE